MMQELGRITGARPKPLKDPLICFPCQHDGQQLPVRGYCQNCQHYLCKACYDIHTVPFPCRDHILLDEANMPKPTTPQTTSEKKASPIGTLTCSKHPKKLVEFYCFDDNEAVCKKCALRQHKSCNKEDIQVVSDDYDLTQEHFNLRTAYAYIREMMISIHKAAAKNGRSAEASCTNTITAIKTAKRKLEANLEKIEAELIAQTEEMYRQDKHGLSTMQDECATVRRDVTQQIDNFEKYETNNHDLYVKAKEACNLLPDLQEKAEKLQARNRSITYRFEADHTFDELLASTDQFGTLHRLKSEPEAFKPSRSPDQLRHKNTSGIQACDTKSLATLSATKDRDIDIRMSEDTRSCNNTGCTIVSPNKLLIVDHNNFTAKLVDLAIDSVTSRMKMYGWPWHVTTLARNEAAVTLVDQEKIQVISHAGDYLSHVRIFNVKGACKGIGATEDKLVVSYYNNTVEIMDHYGTVFQTVRPETAHGLLFDRPYYVAVSGKKGKEAIFTSNSGNDTVNKLDLTTGHVLYTYKNRGLQTSYGLYAGSDGHLLVCSYFSNQVHIVSPCGEKVRTLLGDVHQIKQPKSISVCMVEKKLYITGENNFVNVFNLF